MFLSSPLHYVTSVYSDLHQAFCTTTSIFTHGKKVVIVVGGGCPRALIVIRRQIRKVALGIASSLSGVFVTDKKQKSGEQHVEHILALFLFHFVLIFVVYCRLNARGQFRGEGKEIFAGIRRNPRESSGILYLAVYSILTHKMGDQDGFHIEGMLCHK